MNAQEIAAGQEASTIQRQRSGSFNLYLWGRLHSQYNSHFEAMQAARLEGEHRAFKMLDAMTSETTDN